MPIAADQKVFVVIKSADGAQELEGFYTQDHRFDLEVAFVVSGRTALFPRVHIGDQVHVDDEMAGEVVAIRPSGVAQRWEIHFAKADSFVDFLEGKSSRGRRPKAPEVEEAGEEAGEAGEGPTDDQGGIGGALETALAAADAERALRE
jgi:hypothetical protein